MGSLCLVTDGRMLADVKGRCGESTCFCGGGVFCAGQEEVCEAKGVPCV